MKKSSVLVSLLVLVLLAVGANGSIATYDFTGNMATTQLSTIIYSPHYATVLFQAQNTAAYRRFICLQTNGDYDNKMAALWTAPEGEVITSVTFTQTGNYAAGMNPTVYYNIDEFGPDTPVAWTNLVRSTVTPTLTFDITEAVDSVAFGFDDAGACYASWYIDFSNVVITTQTVPEPATMSLLLIGGVATLIRRRRK